MRQPEQYRWVIVAAGGLLGCVAIGSMFSLPVFLRPIAHATGWSMTGVSTAMTIAFLSMALASFAWGSLADRTGPRLVVLAGSLLLPLSLALASRASSLLAFQLIFGLAVGGSIAAIFARMMACVTGWFDIQRSLAVSLVSAGMGTAPMTMSPLAAWLVTRHDWRTAMLIIAGIAAALMIPVSLLVRARPTATSPAQVAPEVNAADMSVGTAAALAPIHHSLVHQLLLLRHSLGPHLPHGELCRQLWHSADGCGHHLQRRRACRSRRPTCVRHCRRPPGSQARAGARASHPGGCALGYLMVSSLGAFYGVAALFGFIYAGTMPLYSVIARENFPLKMMGTVIGGTAMAGGLGMATGPVFGGMIYDKTGSYSWLFVSSFAMGLGAFLISLTFRPFPPRDLQAATA